MKTGRSLAALATELERQHTTRKDYIAPQAVMTAKVVEPDVEHTPEPSASLDAVIAATPKNILRRDVVLAGLNGADFQMTPHAHRQFATHLGIPQAYYDRMRDTQPALLAENMNTWLHQDGGEKRMVRTLDGWIRAFMSPKYRPLDNFELAEAIFPKLMDLGVQVLSCELTETRMYIKGILPDLSDALPDGVTWGSGHGRIADYGSNERGKVVAAIVVSNSEVGAGSLRVEPSVFTTWCTNLAVMSQAAMRKYHVGRAADAGDDLSIYRDATREADDKAFFMKVQDVCSAAFDRKIFQAAVESIRNAAASPIKSDDLPAVVDMTVKQLALPERTSSGILSMLARGGDLSKWGLSSAITATANTTEDYEQATDLERAGGKVLDLAVREWERISSAKSVAA